MGTALVEPALLTSSTVLGFSYVKTLEFSFCFSDCWTLFKYSSDEIFQSCSLKFPCSFFFSNFSFKLQTLKTPDLHIQMSIGHLLGYLVDILRLCRATLDSLAPTYSLPQKIPLSSASWSHPPFYSVSSTLISKSHLKNVF